MSLRWNLRLHDTATVQSIERHSSVSPIIAQLLAARGFTTAQQVTSFFDLRMTGLRPPGDLPGVDRAVEVILEAITSGKQIFIYGDYDADGMTATAILFRAVGLLGGNVRYFVPSRLDDGYGLSQETLERLHRRGAELVVTVDCGIASVAEVEWAKAKGMQLVITDHHHPGASLPAADAIVHPGLPGSDYPFDGLCGAGVAFKLAWGLCIAHTGSPKLPPRLRDFLFSAVSLAAIGTVCDVVPMKDENRIIVHHGLNCLQSFASPGLQHLLTVSGLQDKPSIDADDLGFSLGPRLNASGRLGQAQLGVELLVCEDPDRARELAEYIDELNKNRKSLEIKIQRSAEKLIAENYNPDRDAALVLANPEWHPGVIGIVAGRLAETYQRPTVLIALSSEPGEPGIGSCRSACHVDLYEALLGCQSHLQKFGGHSGAAGLSIFPESIDAFREDFCEQVAQQVKLEDLYQDLHVDAEALIGHLTFNMMRELEKLAPFGLENPRPVLAVSGVSLEEVKTMGAEDRHLSLRLNQGGNTIRAVAFGKGEWADTLVTNSELYDFAFRPVVNTFRGQHSVELHIIDFRVTESSMASNG